MKKVISLALATFFFSFVAFSQLRKIPSEVTTAFEKQYPAAQEVEYKDILKSVNVHFILDSTKMVAKYNNDGEWKETEKDWNYDKLPVEVKDGFSKSKYAGDEWEIKETTIIYIPGGTETFRLKIEKNEVQKKYLFFNKNGRLVRDAITI